MLTTKIGKGSKILCMNVFNELKWIEVKTYLKFRVFSMNWNDTLTAISKEIKNKIKILTSKVFRRVRFIEKTIYKFGARVILEKEMFFHATL